MDLIRPGERIFLPTFSEEMGFSSPYFLTERVLKGGMGLCAQIKSVTNECFAVKLILSDQLSNKNSYSRFIQEIKRTEALSAHPFIVETFGFCRINDIPGIISKWMPGGDLSASMMSKDPSFFYKTIERTILALEWTYANYNLIHRDLKPSNILLDDKKLSYVTDWGLAKYILSAKDTFGNESQNPNILQSSDGLFRGTSVYASPEQILGTPNIDYRSDIFSLGIIMYEWEMGCRPFDGPTFQETGNNILYRDYSSFQVPSNKSQFHAEKIIAKCLNKKREDRYNSYHELLSDIRQLRLIYDNANFESVVLREKFSIVYDVEKKVTNSQGAEYVHAFDITEQSEAKKQLTKARKHIELKEYQRAITIFRPFFDLRMFNQFPELPFHQEIAINYSFALSQLGKKESALRVILSISKAKLKPVGYFVNLSEIYLSLQNYEQCLNVCENGIALFGELPDLVGNATLSASLCERFNEALKYAAIRLKYNPSVNSFTEAGIASYHFAESLKNIDFPTAFKYYKSATLYFRKAIEINPTHESAIYNLSLTLFKLKRFKESSEVLQKFAQRNEITCFYLARLLLWTGGSYECKGYCQKQLKVFPNSLLIKRIWAENEADSFIIGAKDLEAHVFNDSVFSVFHNLLNDSTKRKCSDFIYTAKLLWWWKDYATSIDVLEDAIKVYPKDWRPFFWKAAFLSTCQRYEDALGCAEKSIKLAPWREKAFYLLAQICHKLNLEDEYFKYSIQAQKIEREKKTLYSQHDF